MWQTKSLGTRRQYSQATVNNVLPLITDSPTFLTLPPNIAHSAWRHGTLWNAIFTSLIASEIDVIDTLRFNNDVDYHYQLATVLEMRLNLVRGALTRHRRFLVVAFSGCGWTRAFGPRNSARYFGLDWTMNIGANRNAHGKRKVSTTTSEWLDSWASRLWRGIELVFKSLDCFTVRPIFSTRPITRMKSCIYFIFYLFIYFFGGWGAGCSAPMHLLFGAVYR